jgi:hypothetical protein
MASAWPAPRKKLPPRASKLDPFKPVVDEILRADLDAPRKQRHTVARIDARLIDEHAMPTCPTRCCAPMPLRKPQIRLEAGHGPAQVFIPQSHRPGAEAEVDFGDVVIRLRGRPVKCALFAFRMSFSRKAVHRVFLSGGQEAFLEGHAHALAVLGGIPTGQVRYDNLKSAVAQVLGFTRARTETDRWTAFGRQVRVLLHASHLVVFDGPHPGRPPRTTTGQRRVPPGARPLPRGVDLQARCAAGRDRAATGPRGGEVHPETPAIRCTKQARPKPHFRGGAGGARTHDLTDLVSAAQRGSLAIAQDASRQVRALGSDHEP